MKLIISIPLILFLLVCSCTTTKNNKDEKIATKRPSLKCMENSPERRGEEGCTILTDRPLVGSLTKTVYSGNKNPAGKRNIQQGATF
jgi:hypothetical protein